MALPEFDEEWIRSVDISSVATATDITRSPMRTVHFAFSCDCSADKLLPFFRSMSPDAVKELYGDDQELQITCPRCGKQFGIHRSEVAEN